MDASRAARALEAWYAAHARDLPWRRTRDPWAILLSEVLLQQTRAATGARRFPALVARFPSASAMAAASDDDVLRAWAGLGYYRRARSLHAAAKAIVAHHDGEVPRDEAALAALPGLGPYTAAAVRAIAFDEPAAPLDANVARVLARVLAETRPVDAPAGRGALAAAARAILGAGAPRILAQALIEVGALVCSPEAPACGACPLAAQCEARARDLQDALPRKRPNAKPRTERWAFARVVRDGAVLLERRGPGLLEGFWALPGAQLRRGALATDALEARLAALGLRATIGAPDARGRWAFTHRTWQFSVHPGRARGGELMGAARWVRPSELPNLPLAQPHLPHLAPAARAR
ncbi:MAG TPA: NUDIX domain-containing protein [Candidatus Thermoplasmatota archaeon]|nr:NUDIX domain-containing protein [Candidatus Thermoplasmatota archaeon]